VIMQEPFGVESASRGGLAAAVRGVRPVFVPVRNSRALE